MGRADVSGIPSTALLPQTRIALPVQTQVRALLASAICSCRWLRQAGLALIALITCLVGGQRDSIAGFVDEGGVSIGGSKYKISRLAECISIVRSTPNEYLFSARLNSCKLGVVYFDCSLHPDASTGTYDGPPASLANWQPWPKRICAVVEDYWSRKPSSEIVARRLASVFEFKENTKATASLYQIHKLNRCIQNCDIGAQLPFGVSFAARPQQESGNEQQPGESRYYYRAERNNEFIVVISLDAISEVIPALLYLFLYVGPLVGLLVAIWWSGWVGGALVTLWLWLILALLLGWGGRH